MSIIIIYPNGGSTTIPTAVNYSSLPPASTYANSFYWCTSSQGTSWLPGSLGGTYYPKGMYYSDGTSWTNQPTPYQATITEVNTGTNDDKFITPSTFTNASKWATKQDSLGYTPLNKAGDTVTGSFTVGSSLILQGTINSSLSGTNARIPSHTQCNVTFTNASLVSIASANNGGVVDGHTLFFTNSTGNSISIVNNYGSASSGEAIYTGTTTNVTIPNNGSFWLRWNSTANAWLCASSGVFNIQDSQIASASTWNNKAEKSNTVLSTYLEIPEQSTPSTPTNAFRLFADSLNRLSWIGENGYVRTFDGTSNTANRTYSLPNASGTLALTSNIPVASVMPLFTPHETFRGVQYANNSTTETTYGGITISTAASTIARSVSTTSYATRQIRKGFVASIVSSGRYTDTRGTALLWYVSGGFRFICDVFISDTAYASGCRQFYGMMGQTTALTYSDTVLVETMVNVIGFGSESSDTNLQVFYNDATGTCSKIDLGSSFPANRSAGAALTSMYSLELYNGYDTNVIYKATNNETGVSVEGTISTNLPSSTQGLNFIASRCMGGGGGVTNSGQFDLGMLGVYSV